MYTTPSYLALLRRTPNAVAYLKGSDRYPDIEGEVRFYGTPEGVLVAAAVSGLSSVKDAPITQPSRRQIPQYACTGGGIFGFHIHEGGACTGDAADPFANAKGHYNPHGCPHPYHAGDLPPLFSAGGIAFSVFLTDRFALSEILGRTVILHAHPDDFSTQPAGAAGERIACGVIESQRPYREPRR